MFIGSMVRLIAILCLLTSSLKAQILFSDNFDGSEIDTSKWDIFLPYADSMVYVQDGILRSKNFGFIVSKQSFSAPYTVSFVSGQINSPGVVIKSNDQFLLRQSGLGSNLLEQLMGAGADNGLFSIVISATDPNSNQPPYAGSETDIPITFNDYGSSITVIDSLFEAFSGTTTYWETPIWPNPEFWPNSTPPNFTGSKIGFFGSAANSEASLFSVQVLSLPEPSALSLLAVGLGGFVMIRRRRS